MKIRRLLVSSLIASAVTLGMSYGAFEYWVTLQINTLSKAVAQGKLTEVTEKDVDQIDNVASFVAQSPLPWHQQQVKHLTDLLEVAQAAEQTFNSKKVSHLQVGQLLTLQREMENYVQRYPNQAFTEEFEQQLPAVRSLVTFFPIIKASAGERSVDSALRASRRGATLAALVIRNPAELVADNTPAEPAVPVVAWSKAENDVLYDYSQALQDAERNRLSNPDRLAIGHQVCSWLETGQGYWGVRSLFDMRYKTQVAGDYYHNRDAYIRFSTERLCPERIASITPPAEPSDVQVAKVPAAVAKVAETAVNSYTSAANPNPNNSPRWVSEVNMPQAPQNMPQYGMPYPIQPLPPGAVPFPGGIR